MRVQFHVQGFAIKDIELSHPEYTEDRVLELLKSGEALPDLTGEKVCLYNEDGEEIVLGKVVGSEDSLHYDNFDLISEDGNVEDAEGPEEGNQEGSQAAGEACA